MNNSWYDTAQICLNGHVVNSMAGSVPGRNQKFCDKCGEPTITSCQYCTTSIRGYYHIQGIFGLCNYSPPSFCHNCGKPFPWTDTAVKAAQELADTLDSLTNEERNNLKRSLDDIVRETPRTTASANKFKRLMAKAGKEAAECFKAILINVASEEARKLIWP